MNFLKLLTLLIVLISSSCIKDEFKEGVFVAGNKYIQAETLNKGKRIYLEYCMPCHGVNGDGKGVSSKGMRVPPRNFKSGLIKFGDVASGDLPHDESVYKTLKHGLKGTAMLPWDMSKKQMHAVWQYIKTFAPDVWIGKDKKLGEKIVSAKDPYGMVYKGVAIKKGKEVYHAVANCQSCHPAYVTKKELSSINKKINGETIVEFEDNLYKTKPAESEHEYLTIPPDFTWDRVRSASTVEELYLRIAAGIGGTTMPAWKGTIEDHQIWEVAYYIKYLMDLKDTPKRKELMAKLKNQ